MPTQEHINEIAGYLKSFEDGTRKHNQRWIHSDCGSAHCLAGWKELDDAIARGLLIKWMPPSLAAAESEAGVRVLASPGHDFCSGWDYAAAAWQLDVEEDEDYMLFDPTATLEEMKENLRSIADNHGLTCPI